MSHRPAGSHPTRPRTYNLSVKSIFSFPLRICNPPPAVAKVRSCGVTPLFKVQLEDVLDRNHLPPLGLKDFEEWLLYVEMSPENLYFTLWLREYRQRYSAWMAQNKFHREMNGEFRMNWETHHSPSLAMFYARAKQTFFTPNSPYELNLPSSLLAVFHTSMVSPHPDPAIFTDVAIETYRMLDESLRRFVSAQFNNVGNNRVLCGIIAGILFALLGSIPPIVVNFTKHQSRWLRIVAFPGLFLGLAILVSAFHGVCLGVYIFGDLRQLRKFELARPPISRPIPISDHKSNVPSIHSVVLPLPSSPSNVNPEPLDLQEKTLPTVDNRVAHLVRPLSLASDNQSLYSVSEEDPTTGEHAPAEIHISPAFYENPSMMDLAAEGANFSDYAVPSRPGDDRLSPINSDFTATATFIHPFDAASIDFNDCDRPDFSPAQRQRIDAFDFDSLPPLQGKERAGRQLPRPHERNSCPTLPPLPPLTAPSPTCHSPSRLRNSHQAQTLSPITYLERQQSSCDIKKWRSQTESTDQISPVTPEGFPSGNPYNAHILHSYKSRRSLATETTFDSTETKVQQQSKLMKAVPAFAVPLTRVLSPVIRRGQWEIVVRSAAISLLVSWAIVGVLLAIPVPSHH